jgi:phosphoglycolate phosphatase-like HAD superfamily hydrolase/transcriptional regulator with XRE-family HTH domain
MIRHTLTPKMRRRLQEALGEKTEIQLSDKTGISQPTLSKLMKKGLKTISQAQLESIAKATNVEAQWLLDHTDKGGPKERLDAKETATDLSSPETGQSNPDERPTHATTVPQSIDHQERTGTDILSFISALDLPNVAEFSIFSITGELTVKSFLTAIELHPWSSTNIKCRILLRSPFSTNKRRGAAFGKTIANLQDFRARYHNFDFEVRTYSSSIPLHGVICRLGNGKHSGFLSSYVWTNLNSREIFSGHILRKHDIEGTDPSIGTYISWFEHFWGRHKIHTIILDFDDTLFETTRAQVEAWITAIRYGLDRRFLRLSDLQNQLSAVIYSEQDASTVMTKIFLHGQDEEGIIRGVFKRSISSKALEDIRPRRIAKREELTERYAKPISAVVSDVWELRNEYQLVIISATSESLINRVLRAKNLNIFSYVIGREARRHEWQGIENKAQHFIRVSNMLGIPLERMVFVGDSDADFKAARQIGVHFIENWYNASQHQSLIKRKSLIKSGRADHRISGSAEGELRSTIGKIEADINWIK